MYLITRQGQNRAHFFCVFTFAFGLFWMFLGMFLEIVSVLELLLLSIISSDYDISIRMLS